MNAPERNHAFENAHAWAETIAALAAALGADYEQDEPPEAATVDGDTFVDSDAVHERIQESPLSLEVRSGWYEPGAEDTEPEEFCILLSTGGPALRIIGKLRNGEPHNARLEYQDWGTAWSEYHGEGCSNDDLLTFCQQFYFVG